MTTIAPRHVIVSLPTIGDVAATVEHIDDESLHLVLPIDTRRDLRSLRGAPATVSYATRRGVHELAAAVVPGPGGALILNRTGHDKVVQRREWFRVDTAVPLTVIWESRRATGTALNLSGGGLLITDTIGLPIGAEVALELQVGAGHAPVPARATVMRDAGPERRGLRLDHITAEDRRRLVRFVTERERLSLRIASGE
jgi:PilZ domain